MAPVLEKKLLGAAGTGDTMENSNEDDEGQNLWYARTLKVSRSAADFAGSYIIWQLRCCFVTSRVLPSSDAGPGWAQNTLHKLIAKSESGEIILKVLEGVRKQIVSLYMLMSLILVWIAFVKTQRFMLSSSRFWRSIASLVFCVYEWWLFYYDDNVKCQESDPWCLFLMRSNGWLTFITSESFLVLTAFSGCFGSIIVHSYSYLPSELTIKLLTTVLNPCLLMLWMLIDCCSFVVLFFRSSILSEVSTRSSSKLPSGKNILLFGICLFLLNLIFNPNSWLIKSFAYKCWQTHHAFKWNNLR